MNQFLGLVERLDDRAIKLRLTADAASQRPLTRRDVQDLWATDDDFCAVFSDCLTAAPFDAFAWETPRQTARTLDLPFECVVTRSPALARQRADPLPFAAQFRAAGRAEAISFQNLGGDAELVVPTDRGEGVDHAHLASFLRTASAGQRRELWRLVAQTMGARLARGVPFWLSTAGLGVAWLHVRFDDRPKYYVHAPYRSLAA
jgi:hypothetical protein